MKSGTVHQLRNTNCRFPKQNNIQCESFNLRKLTGLKFDWNQEERTGFDCTVVDILQRNLPNLRTRPPDTAGAEADPRSSKLMLASSPLILAVSRSVSPVRPVIAALKCVCSSNILKEHLLNGNCFETLCPGHLQI